MKTRQKRILNIVGASVLAFPLALWGQQAVPPEEAGEAEQAEQQTVQSEVTVGLYYMDDDSYRYGKYTGLTDEGAEALIDFRVEKRPAWDSGDGKFWRLQGWRVGLDSRRIEFDYKDLGRQSLNIDYREIPNNRYSDGVTPYRGVGTSTLTLPETWVVAPGSNNTRGFTALNENLVDLAIDSKRRWMDLSYALDFADNWNFKVDYKHDTKEGERTIGSIFGYTGGNPRSVILPMPTDYQTDNVEAMIEFGTTKLQFGFGMFASFFNNDESSLVWQNAYGFVNGWAPSVSYPTSQGRLALEPDNSYLQFKAYGGINFNSSTRLTADVSFGEMEQDEALLPYTINPNLIVHTPLPRQSADAQIDTMLLNLRLTSQLARRLGVALNYRYDDRDNKTPRAAYPYIGGDSQDQRPDEDARINLPYSYTEEKADAVLTYRVMSNLRFKGGVEYSDYSREYSEVNEADEMTWLAGINLGPFEWSSFSLDYRDSDRDIKEYVGNLTLIESHLPGVIAEDEWENHPLLRKYFLTDRKREEYRFRADLFPAPQVNFGFAASHFQDDYDEGYFGLTESEVNALTFDFGWYPLEHVALTAYYTSEQYDASQSGRAFSDAVQAADPNRNWFADTDDDVDTYNAALEFSEIGASRGWKGFDFGFDYTVSEVESIIKVTAVTLPTAPLPPLRSDMRSISAWASLDVGANSTIRLAAEDARFRSTDFGLDNVLPATLANVLTHGERSTDYDILLISGSWTYRF